MSHITNLKKSVFLTAGITDAHINKMEYDWLVQQYGSAPSNTLPGMWYHYLLSQGQAEGSLPGMMDRWLVGLGYTTGTIDSKLAAMWAAGGPVSFDGAFWADFESGADAVFGGGDLTGTLYNGATVHDGLLDLISGGGTKKYISWDADDNYQPVTTGCIRVLYKPNFSGSPATYQQLFSVGRVAGTNNSIEILHSTASQLLIYMYNASGGTIIGAAFGSLSPTTGTEYEIELNFDIAAGATRLFVNGTQSGPTNTNTGTLTSETGNIIKIGDGNLIPALYKNECQILDIQLFNTVQHTSDY